MLTGCAGYVGHLATPDWREIIDSQHYYSDMKEIPASLREPLFSLYARMYDCRMDEAEVSDYSYYPTFAAFFNRPLKKELRPISATPLVSPADGIVLHYGKVEDGRIEFVKGHDYDIKEFLGQVELPQKEGYDLCQLVIYLAPGNYHAFHSPCRWKADHIEHFPGLLLSVRPSLLSRVPHLFCLNERVVINGRWAHGFFSLSAVAATNVGDVAIEADSSIRTNLSRKRKDPLESVRTELSHAFLPGEKVGEFRLGSTVVLIFHAPKSVKFAVEAGDSLRYGQSLLVELS